MITVRIWDAPTRLFHWSLVLCITALVITGEIGGDAMLWHFRLGYAVLTLLGFRLLWGFVGGHWSRWWRLPLSPASVRAYLRGHAPLSHTAGHNPLGSWSVLGLLVLTALQASTGLFSDDEIAHAGPLSALLSAHWVSGLTAWHTHLGKTLLLGLVALHVLAILGHRLRHGHDLLRPMLHGNKRLPAAVPASRDGMRNWLLALLCLAL
ncbi:MAG: cytochrome B, partial [Betaproteobacteria bacterium]|nr:cytochrome B [Betaproteobacteria bacterium]